jgi:hypothetical protein
MFFWMVVGQGSRSYAFSIDFCIEAPFAHFYKTMSCEI